MRTSDRSLSATTAIFIVLLLGFVLTGCARMSPRGSPSWDGETLYLALIWHQHQPLYYKDPDTGVYTRPWGRVHATKDYYDMAAMLENYPELRVTINLAWPGENSPSQEEILSTYSPSRQSNLDLLSIDDYASVPMNRVRVGAAM